MKKVLYLFLIIFVGLTMTSCAENNNLETNNEDALKFKEEYESLNGEKISSGKEYPTIEIAEDNVIKYSDADEISNIIKKGTGVIYFGFPECPWCRNVVPALLESAKETGIDKIYYMNLTDERDTLEIDENGQVVVTNEGTKGYQKLLDVLNEYLPDYDLKDVNENVIKTGKKRIYVPFTVFVYEGEIVGVHDDTVESHKDPYVLLNKKQKEELMMIYIDYMHKVLNDVCDEKC